MNWTVLTADGDEQHSCVNMMTLGSKTAEYMDYICTGQTRTHTHITGGQEKANVLMLLTASDVTRGLHHLVPVAGLTTWQLLLTAVDVIVHCTFVFHSHVVSNCLVFQ